MRSASPFGVSLLVSCLVAPLSHAQDTGAKTTAQRLADLESRADATDSIVNYVMDQLGSTSPLVDCDSHASTFITHKDSTLSFFVSCEKLEPYLEGFRLTVTIGNPYAMKFDDIQGQVGYGDTSVKSFKGAIPITTVTPLNPGVWNRFEVVIPRVEPKDVRFIRIMDLRFNSVFAAPR